MLAYVVRRVALAVSMVWAISFGAFLALGLSFDPTYQYNLCQTNECRQQHQQLIAQFHLHDPILSRYWRWFTDLFHHGFGRAVLGINTRFGSGVDIGSPLWHATAATAQLMAAGFVLTVILSVGIGVASARRPGSALDVVLRFFAYVTWSVPTFLVGVLLARWLGPTGWFYGGTPGGSFVTWIRTMALPASTLSLGLVGLYSRYIRTAMLTSLHQPYAVVARSKGLTEQRVVYRHALRNSLIPFVSVISLDMGAIVGASLAADYVFGMGGLANLFVTSIGQADPFTMTAILVVIGAIVAAFGLLSEVVVGWLDPRTGVAARA